MAESAGGEEFEMTTASPFSLDDLVTAVYVYFMSA